MKTLLKHWDIGIVESIAPTAPSASRTWFVKTAVGREFVLKASDVARSEREVRISRALSTTQVPVASPVTTVEGKWYVEDDNGVYCLYLRLPGAGITEYYGANAVNEALALGRAIGLLHTGLRECEIEIEHRDLALIAQIEDWALPRVRENGTLIDVNAIERIWRDAALTLKLWTAVVRCMLLWKRYVARWF